MTFNGGDVIVALVYLPPNSSPLRQGEILENLFELQPRVSPGKTVDVEQETMLDRIDHPYAIVVSQDCDLEWDYKARQGQASEDKILTHVLFCALFLRDEIKIRSRLKSDLMKRVDQNQDERYHRFDEAPVADTGYSLPELYADFKTIFSLPIEFVYSLTLGDHATRRGFLPSPYVQDFMHRLYSFLGRVAIPDS